ncbi:hypothetical protein BTO06_07835 [Tenacibaculum sp. SZ-18]|nr:tetratricopeptide repeat-containing sensor histidine kinase [Tenacibaculum sp. SZ-18]AUC15051.1 hypothetical protein BTO06_07835 [Tenacibaculum sp. SZ-18]
MLRTVFVFLLLGSSVLYSQKNKDIIYEIGKSICNESKTESLYKALTFYKNNQFDSCYVYSSVALSESKSIEERNFVNYIKGVSAFQKDLLKQAKTNFAKIDSSDNIINNLKNLKLGQVCLSLKQYNEALSYYTKWEAESGNTNREFKKNAFHNIGLCFIHKKNYEKAEEYFEKELSLIKKNDTSSLIRTKMDLANIYYNEYLDDDAIPLFKEAYDLAQMFSDVELKKFTTQNMAVIERNRKGYKESVNYYIEYVQLKDSIWNRDKIIDLANRDKEILFTQKENEIKIQEEKIEAHKVVQKGLIFGASGLLVFLGFWAFYYNKLKEKNSLITKQKEDLSFADKTKNYLLAEVSHDLRSPMNTIKHQHLQLKKYIDDNNLEGIKEANNSAITVTESTSHLLNNLLHWSLEQNNQMVFDQKEYPFKPIVEHVLYDYENLIEANDVKIKTNYIKNSLIKVDRESLKIVLRNLLDNSVKYMNGEGEISIEMGVDSENYAYVSIQDTGIGITAERLAKINRLKDVSIDKINRS